MFDPRWYPDGALRQRDVIADRRADIEHAIDRVRQLRPVVRVHRAEGSGSQGFRTNEQRTRQAIEHGQDAFACRRRPSLRIGSNVLLAIFHVTLTLFGTRSSSYSPDLSSRQGGARCWWSVRCRLFSLQSGVTWFASGSSPACCWPCSRRRCSPMPDAAAAGCIWSTQSTSASRSSFSSTG